MRHSRSDEESGRLELVGATQVGRVAPLSAAITIVVSGLIALGLLTAISLAAVGLPLTGSLVFGLTWTTVGLVFTGVAVVAAQLARTARAAIGLSLAVLGAAYLIRAAADSADSLQWLSWLSPLGIGGQARAFQGDRWGPLAILAVLGTALIAVGSVMQSNRELGAGVIAERSGPSVASPALTGAFGLAWRLQRNVLFAWVVSFAIMGAVLGNIASNVGELIGSPEMRKFFEELGGRGSVIDVYFAGEMGLVGVFASAYSIQAVHRMRSEEAGGRVGAVLATDVSRIRLMSSHLLIALAGSALLLFIAALAAGLADAAQTGGYGRVGPLLAAAAAQTTGAWVMAGIAVALYGLLPRFAQLCWMLFVVFVLLVELGPLLQLNQWIIGISPYSHVPKLPAAELSTQPVAALFAIALVLVAVALTGFRKRDIA